MFNLFLALIQSFDSNRIRRNAEIEIFIYVVVGILIIVFGIYGVTKSIEQNKRKKQMEDDIREIKNKMK